ncbi:MAG: hypothetical protein GX235_08460 [Clostridiales bacterium]|nr:hypothetical protein [Clostridiales bacterium]
MDEKEQDKITAFDVLFTNNHIQILKIIIPYFDSQMQKQLSIYVKFLELQYTISYYQSRSYELRSCAIKKEEFNINKICSEILPYCTKEEKQKVEQIMGMFRSIDMYKEMSKTFELMKELFPEGFEEGFGNDFSFGAFSDAASDASGASEKNHTNMNMTDLLMNMLSPEQKAMFEMFGGNNYESGRMDE